MAHLFGISVSDSFLSWILLGLLAGWIAGLISGRGFGFLGDILVGLIGSVLGGWIFFRLGILGGGGFLYSLAAATVGALALIVIVGFFRDFSRR